MSSDLKRLSDAMRAIKKELSSKGIALVKEAFDDFFQKHTEVLEVRWTQYTPYFNDGDVCEFRVNDFVGVTQSDLDEVQSEDIDDMELFWGSSCVFSKEAAKDLDAIYELLSEDDFLQTMLGDHLKVKVTRSGVDVDEYEHD